MTEEHPQRPNKPGTAPNTSLVLTAEELAFIRRRGGKSATIHEALRRMMEQESAE